ncbi:MAG: hypothetical protein KC910_31620 [Candidatus Eremiobacteraeota bacterium]|nr:hypothetical protein [Candidatus Eremiobacteraeota bacterium]
MLTINPYNRPNLAQANSLRTAAPPSAKPVAAPTDSFSPSATPVPTPSAQAPESKRGIATAILIGLGVAAVAVPMAGQVLSSVCLEQPTVAQDTTLRFDQMEEAAKSAANENSQAQQIRSDYGKLVEQTKKAATQFEATRAELEALETPKSSFDLHPDGSFVEVIHQGETTRVVSRDAQGHEKTLVDTGMSVTVTTPQNTSTLYTRDSILHRAGDFVVQQWNGQLQASGENPTRLTLNRVEHGFAGDVLIHEEFEKPEISLGLYPNPVFTYHNETNDGQATRVTDVTIRSDGSTVTRQGGSVSIKPGVEVKDDLGIGFEPWLMGEATTDPSVGTNYATRLKEAFGEQAIVSLKDARVKTLASQGLEAGNLGDQWHQLKDGSFELKTDGLRQNLSYDQSTGVVTLKTSYDETLFETSTHSEILTLAKDGAMRRQHPAVGL